MPKYPVINGVQYGPGDAEICLETAAGKREYYNRTREMSARQDEICPLCKQFMISPTFDHQDGRGLGSGHRNDALIVDGNWHNAALCWDCNAKKSSKRYHWSNGKYVPRVIECIKEDTQAFSTT